MRSDDHEEFFALAVGWTLHALEPAEEDSFAGHLVTCDRCQQLVRESEEALGVLANDVPLADPPAQLLQRIRQATGASDAGPGDPLRVSHTVAPVVTLPRRSVPRRRRWVAAAVAAGLVLIALLGWNVALQRRVDDTQRIAAQRQGVITELAKSSTRAVLTDRANRTVGYVVQRGSGVDIVAGGLKPNDRVRTTYVLWALQGSGGPPQAVGTFDIVKGSMDVRGVNGSPPTVGTFTGFAVTEESGRSVPDRPSQVVASGAVLS